MTQTLENNRWWRDKRPVVEEYLATAKQVEDVVAGRGLLYRPGYLGATITTIERGAKFKLSEINYQIVAQSIERELAQTGHDYDIAVKEAMIAWELERGTILTALEQEFADNKNLRDLDDQVLDRLEITTNLRKLFIMGLKTALDVEMEELRQEMTDVDRSTFAAEDALLAARLLTAQKKLTVIPYIEMVLIKQQLIINKEQENATRKGDLITKKKLLNDKKVELITAREFIADAIVDLIAAKQVLITKKESLIDAKELIADQEGINIGYLDSYIKSLSDLGDVQHDLITAKKDLIPYITDKSLALIAYAAELDAWVKVKDAIAVIKEEIATEMEDRVDKKGDIIDARVDLNDFKLALQEAEIDLEIATLTGRAKLMTQKIGNAALMLTERETSFDAKIKRESELISGQIDLRTYEEQVAFETMEAVNDISIDAEVDSLERIVEARIDEKEELADIASEAEITSQLVHLLA